MRRSAVTRSSRPRVRLAEENAGDHEPRDHIEDVDADIAPSQPGDIGVEQRHEHDGNGSQALHVGAKAAMSGGVPASSWATGEGSMVTDIRLCDHECSTLADTPPQAPVHFWDDSSSASGGSFNGSN